MENVLEGSRCMWCGASSVEIHHQFVLPICSCCLRDFQDN